MGWIPGAPAWRLRWKELEVCDGARSMSVTQQSLHQNLGLWPRSERRRLKALWSRRRTQKFQQEHFAPRLLEGPVGNAGASFLLWPYSHCWAWHPALHRAAEARGRLEWSCWAGRLREHLNSEGKPAGLGGATYLPKRNISDCIVCCGPSRTWPLGCLL